MIKISIIMSLTYVRIVRISLVESKSIRDKILPSVDGGSSRLNIRMDSTYPEPDPMRIVGQPTGSKTRLRLEKASNPYTDLT